MMIYEVVIQALVSLFRTLLATMSHLWGEAKFDLAQNLFIHSFRYATLCGGLVSSLLILLSQPLIRLLGGDKYLPATFFLQILAIQLVIRMPYEIITVVFYLHKLTWRMLAYNFIRTCLEFMGYGILLTTLGPLGAPVTHVFSFVAALFMFISKLFDLDAFNKPVMFKILIRVLSLFVLSVVPFAYLRLEHLVPEWLYLGITIPLVSIIWLTGALLANIITIDDIQRLKAVSFNIGIIDKAKDAILSLINIYFTWISCVIPARFKAEL